jgi:chromosome partitioning protein
MNKLEVVFLLKEYNENKKNTKVLSILNNKGGCGKTSVVGNLGYALSELNKRILFIDADMQSNLTHSIGLDEDNDNHLGTALMKEENLENYIEKTKYEKIDFIKAHLSMSTLEMSLFTKIQRESILRHILEPIIEKGIYDYILIDTNPTLAILNFNVLNASDYVIIPVQMNSFALKGLVTVLDFIKGVKKYNTKLTLMGILINSYDKRKNVTFSSEEFLRSAYNDLVLNTIIQIDTTIENAQYHREPTIIFNPNSRISNDFRNLAREVIYNAEEKID